MRKIKFFFSNGTQTKQEDIFEYNDDVTSEEIDRDLKDWVNNYIDYGWYDLEEE